MKLLKQELERIMKEGNVKEEEFSFLKKGKEVEPFSKEATVMAYLLSKGLLTYEKYLELKEAFEKRNKYLYLYDMAPRTYGQTWGEAHIRTLHPHFLQAKKKILQKYGETFYGEYDLWLNYIRVELKACRANEGSSKNAKKLGSLASRAYSYQEAREKNFLYHFQQIKVSCCDVFIFLGTCKDQLLYWVLTSEELVKTGKIKPQHRQKGEEDRYLTEEECQIYEGQVFMSEEELEPYKCKPEDLEKRVEEKRSLIERLKNQEK